MYTAGKNETEMGELSDFVRSQWFLCFFNIRLYLPLSKRQEYLQSSGEKVLASFPVQATIHFYNDESESDSEEEQEEEAQPKCLQSQEAARQGSGPGGKGRVGLADL